MIKMQVETDFHPIMYFIPRQPSLVAKSHICRRRGRKKTLPIQGNYHQNI